MKGLLQQRDILQHPAIDRGMVDLDAPFFHHLLELTVADRICDVPAYAPEEDVPLEMAASKIDHRGLSPFRGASHSYTRSSRARSCDRTHRRARLDRTSHRTPGRRQ